MKGRKLRIGFILVFAFMGLGVGSFSQDVSLTVPIEKRHPKLESALDQLVRAYQAGGMIEAAGFADRRAIELVDSLVRVEIEVKTNDKAQIDRVIKAIESLGGKFETSYEHRVQALVPVAALTKLAELPEIHFIDLPLPLVPDQGSIVSQGVTVIGADRWQQAGITGRDVKVGILDSGFRGLSSVQAQGELPANVVTRSFRADGSLDGGTVHGTGVAEIVHDVAPGAQLFLVNAGTTTEAFNAIDFLLSQGVQVINHSRSSFTGCYQGEGGVWGPIMRRVRQDGVLWVNSAGNRALQHWQGDWRDDDNDNTHNFTDTDETQSFPARRGEFIRVELSWLDPCDASANDYDLFLLDGSLNVVARSTNIQDGNDRPREFISFRVTTSGTYHISIRRDPAARPVRLKLFLLDRVQEYPVPAGSLVEPAISPNVLAAGATFWRDDSLEKFSSQGPTADGRIKPDIAAPDGVANVSYSHGFFGTSASAPHVAGAAALVKQAFPNFTPDQIQQFLEQRAEDLGPPGKDNQFGAGRLSLGPVPTVTAPKPPSELVATALSPFQIELRWKDNSDNEDGFKIERRIQGGEFAMIAQVPANTTSFTDVNLTPTTIYCYRVMAFNAAGDSPPSNEACATTPSALRLLALRSGEPVRETAEPGPKTLSLTQYTLEVLPGVRRLVVRLRALGNLDLHLRFRKPVEVREGKIIADASSAGPTGLESLELWGEVLQIGTYYVAIENQESSPQSYVLVGALAPVIVPLALDTPVVVQLAGVVQTGVLEVAQYLIEVPSGAKSLTIKLENEWIGQFNAYVRFGQAVELVGGQILADQRVQMGLEGIVTITLEGEALKAGRYYLAFENLEPYAQRFTLLASLAR